MLHNIFDSHAHYDSPRFNKDRQELLEALPSQGVRAVLTAASTLASAKKAAELSRKYDYIYCSAGIHPHDAKGAPPNLEEEIRRFSQNPKMKAVGEIGLDYYYDYSPRECQKDIFIRQIKVAKELDLPVIVHNRDAHEDTLEILLEYQPKGVVHSYSGSVEMAEQLLKIGFYFGFTGVLTFKNARRPVEAVAAIPLDKLLVETDCPYMAPVPLRGERSDSSMISYIATRMAEIKGLEPQQILDQTFENACRLFNINQRDAEATPVPRGGTLNRHPRPYYGKV